MSEAVNRTKEKRRIKCRHDPFMPRNHLVIESHWAAGVRVRCRKCGAVSWVSKKGGRIEPLDTKDFLPVKADK